MACQKAGGAGKWFGPGYVYVMKDKTGQKRNGNLVKMFKIGHSNDPNVRLGQIQKDLNPNTIELLGCYEANESNTAETAAQKAVKDNLGMVKDSGRGNATDWFENPKGKSDQDICNTVETAVKAHNKEKQK